MKLIETINKWGEVLLVNPELVQAYNVRSGQLYLNGAGAVIAEKHRFAFGGALTAEAEELVKVNDF